MRWGYMAAAISAVIPPSLQPSMENFSKPKACQRKNRKPLLNFPGGSDVQRSLETSHTLWRLLGVNVQILELTAVLTVVSDFLQHHTDLHQIHAILCVPLKEVWREVSARWPGPSVAARIPANHSVAFLVQPLELRVKVSPSTSCRDDSWSQGGPRWMK